MSKHYLPYTDVDNCPNCGASTEENEYETENEFYEPVIKCAACGYTLGEA